MGLPLQTVQFYDNGAGIDLNSSPTKVAENAASLCLNIDYSTDGAFKTRYGSSIQNKVAGVPAQMSGAPTTLAMYDYHGSDGTDVYIFATSDGKIKHATALPGAAPSDVVTGLTVDSVPDFEFITTGSGDYLIFGNGVDTNLKFNGTNWTNLALPQATAPSFNSYVAGALPDATYTYYMSFAVTSGGIIIQESQLSTALTVVKATGITNSIIVNTPVCTETVLAGVTQQCNARVLYRRNNSTGVVYRITTEATIADNVTLTYTDNTLEAALSSIEADFDNEAPPPSAIFELDDYGAIWFQDSANLSWSLTAVPYQPWNCPSINVTYFDASLQCMKRCFGTIVFGTNKSLWVQNGDYFNSVVPRRFSSKIGIMNNRCAAGEDILYILSNTARLYTITPTDFSQNEMRISDPISTKVNTLFSQIGAANYSQVCLEYYSIANIAKVMISAPLTTSTNNRILVFNELQSQQLGVPVWQVNDNQFVSCLRQMNVSGESGLYSGDYNGFIWKLEDTSLYGDGAEENGTVTSSTNNTLTDTSQSWTVNSLVGCVVRIIGGYDEDDYRTVVSNTADTLTVDSNWDNNPNTTSTFTVGGYDAYQYSNWKMLLQSYDVLKQLWYIIANANASGDYTINLIIQTDFNQSAVDQANIDFSLLSGNAIWGSFIWGEAIWGSQSVFQSRYRYYSRFRAIRIGFLNRKAGQPYQINGFSLSAQNKALFYGSSS